MKEKAIYNLTTPQKSILLTEQFFSGSNINNICGTAFIDEKIDFDLLNRAVNLVVEHNDSFRIRLCLDNNEVMQYLSAYEKSDIEIIDVNSKEDVSKIENDLMNQVFDIYDNLFIFKLFRFPNGNGGFLLNIHHLISDSWTLGLVAREIVRIYSCLLNNEEPDFSTFSSYIDYISEEQSYIKSDKFKKDKEYWNSIFSTIPESASIPSRKQDSNAFSSKANRLIYSIPKEDMDKIKTYCKELNVSAFNFFMAMYAIYTGKVSNLDDFVIGTPILNRTNFKEKNTTGMFINIVPCRINMNDNPTFRSFVASIAKDSLGMLRHQKYSYQYILEDLRKQNPSLPNLYNMIMSYQITKANAENGLSYETRWAFNGNCSDDFDIHMYDLNDTGSVNIAYDYRVDKYDEQEISDVHNRILHMIHQIINNNSISINDIEIVTPSEKNEILYEFNNTHIDYEKEKTIIDLFEEQVNKTPNNIAITCNDQNLTYAELNMRANQLARYLVSSNVKFGDVIGIMVNRSLEMVIGLLGILKSGAAYLPIDPDYPSERISYMLENSHTKKVLVNFNTSSILPEGYDKIDISFSENFFKFYENKNLDLNFSSLNLMYLIYTSGSTGNPKGVMLTHQNIHNFIIGMTKQINFSSDKVMVSLTTICFDIFVLELWCSLTHGLRVIIANELEQKDVTAFNTLCLNNNVSMLQTTPSRLSAFLDNPNQLDYLSNLTDIMIGGEPLPEILLQKLKMLSHAKIYNMYGPTETAVWSTMKDLSDTNNISIGKPISNTICYILDKNKNLLPPYIPGELYIGGDGVSNGYLNRKELTKEKFISSPFDANKLIYNTGDLAYFTNDGEIIHLGRTDFQVKIRGYRVELGEIENIISSFDKITNCVVMCHHVDNKQILCAYYTSKSEIDTSSLKNYILQKLPTYMVPSHFIHLDSFPQTPNGKIDRKALNFHIETNEEIVLPKNDVEEKLFKLIASIIHSSNFSMTDNLFNIGMDSIAIVSLCTQINNVFGVSFSIKKMYEINSIIELANSIMSHTSNTNIIEKAEISPFYHLSSAQTRIYYATKMAEDNNILYNIPGGMLVNAVLDSTKIENAFKKLIMLHSSFRTCFKIIDDIPCQVVFNDVDFHVEVQHSKEANLESIVNDFPKAFDLEKAPLLRVCVHYLDNKKTLILIDSHHIIVDGTSLNILIRDFCKLYNNINIEKSDLEYVDYAVWENDYINSTEIADKENYWIDAFKDSEIPVINLPYDYNIPATISYAGNRISMNIPDDIFTKFDAIAKEMQCSSYMVFLATFYILLYKYTSQDNIVVGTPIANRNINGLENIIGMFVNNIALNGHIDSTKTFRAFLGDIKSLVIDALTNQPYPYDLLVKKLNLNGKKLFDVMFTYQNTKKDTFTIENSDLEIIESNTKTAKFNLSLEVVPDRNLVNLEYRTDLFKDETASRLLNHYMNLLNYVSNHIDDKICDIDMLSQEEKNKILYDFNDTKMEYPRDKTIVDLFEEQVKLTPNATAVVFENKTLTYAELNEKSNKLAAELTNRGIGHKDVVGVLLPRSIELIISIFAILKNGSTYMPLYVNYPCDRIHYMLHNSITKLVITNTNYISTIPDDMLSITINNFDELSNLKDYSRINSTTSDIAYIIYTSGSTGKPKGVQITNDCLNNFVHAFKKYFKHIDVQDCFLSSTNISFDVSIFEIFLPLLSGASLVLYHSEIIKDIMDYCDYIEKHNITALYIPPNILDEVYSILKDKNSIKINKLLIGVEAIKKSTIDKYFTLNPDMCIVNGYGPTETTICCTALEYSRNLNFDTDIISIGKPLYNDHIYILDENKNIQAIGIPGELYVTGSGVGAGYAHNEEETLKNYLTNPFDCNSNKMYKTGDLGKWNTDGTISLIGRKDEQVKISGYRIELKEIDSVIMTYPNITKSITIVVKNGQKNRLISYFTAAKIIDAHDLLSYLNKKLTFYMIPAKMVQLENFPITANGKIDKRALPLPSFESEKEYVAPKTKTQKMLCSIWSDLFKLDKIGIYDDFFNLGGDSLLSIKLTTKIYDVFHIELTIGEIFNHSTIESLSEFIDNSSSSKKICITKYDKRDFYPVSSAQKRMYLASIIDANSTLYNVGGGLLLDTLPNVDKLQKAFNTVISRHEILRTYFEVIDGNIVQKVKENLEIKINIETVNTNDIDALFKEHQTIFDLNIAPLLKVSLLQLPSGKALLILDAHHIIMDGTSLNNLIQEFSDAYNNKQLPELPIDYKDFAIWEEEQLQENTFKASKDFWVEKFKDDVPILNMPTTYSRPANKSYEGDTIVTSISDELTKKINEFSTKYHVTPYMFMLACYYVLLYKYTNQEDIVVGSPISGRPYAELESLLGMFVNSLPLRNTVSCNLGFEEFLLNVKNSCMEAFSHQDYPFDVLVSDLNIARDNSRSPLFDTMFIYQNNGFRMFDFDNINAHYKVPASHTSKFDLSLEVLPQDNILKLSFEYCTELFDADFIKKFATHYLNVIKAVLEKPSQKIADISILSNEEMSQILYDFNDTKMDYPSNKTIATLFEEQVEKTPEHIAVVFEDKKLTYKELNEKANQLAWYLGNCGISNSKVVGIMLPRSLEILVAMLGVLKTGACYIPIDPTLPTNRINYMLNNSNADMILTLDDTISSDITIRNVNINLNNDIIYCGNNNNLNILIDQNAPSYMIYTSGSTGTPKGVVLNHKALVNLATYLNNNVEFLKDEYTNIAMASITTISFDIFIFETLVCLQRGLKIVIANEAEQNTPNLLDDLIMRNNVKAIQMTPSRMYIFINNKNLMPHLNQLKYVVLAGEALPKDLLDRILELGDINVYNGYGPSETTVFSTFTDVTNYTDITIGKPLGNTRIYILDNDMSPVPIGNPGEMYIAGAGVGIGYSNNEEITKERFLPDAFYPNERMYKTGDLAKFLPNGEIHYIGRVDHQIKIRGLRIELDEIENCILKYPNIDKCIIMADTDNNHRQFIVAYLSVTDRISVNKLRMFLKTLLPKYMVPSYFIILDKIPYLNNGKINKKALPKPEINSSSSTTEYIAPRNKIELQIATIFQSLLSISPIGINDNFFELGGDSLLAINLQVELLKLNFNITYSDIFMYPTIKDLAKKIVSNEVTTFNDINASDFIEFNKILDNNCLVPSKIEYKALGNVIITGTTGFLGAHVLDAYLKNETGTAYCFVRPEAGLTLENKFMKKLHFYFGDKYDSLVGNRIVIVNADIAENNLGLSDEKAEVLANDISCVINCAAKVSHFGNYNNYKQINVTGTENLLKFCMQFDKRFYQISTLSVSGNSLVDQSYIEQDFENDIIFKENDFYIHQNLDNVYVRSKFEAEKLVLQYILNGLDGYICRVGNLMNRTSDGKFQPNVDENAYISRLLSLANIGCIPDYLLNGYMEFTPIDCCAEAIIKLAEHPTSTNRIFHLYDRNHVDVEDFISIFRKYIPFEVVSNEEFINKINAIFKQENSNKILSGILRDFDTNEKLVYGSKVKLNCDFTVEYLSKIGFIWPKIDENYLKKFLDYYCSLGYITRKEKI